MKIVGLIIVFFICLVLFPDGLKGQTKIVAKDRTTLSFVWHDPNTDINVLAYNVYPSFTGQTTVFDTTYVMPVSDATPDSFTIYVTCVGDSLESAPSNVLTIIRVDTIHYEPSWPKHDFPLTETVASMRTNWKVKHNDLGWSKISFDTLNTRIYFYAGIGNAFVWRTINNSIAQSYSIDLTPTFFYGAALNICIDDQCYAVPSNGKMTISIPIGEHELMLRAFNNTVFLQGDPILKIVETIPGVPLAPIFELID